MNIAEINQNGFIKINLFALIYFSVFGLMGACAQAPQPVDNIVQKQINDKKIVGAGVAVVRERKSFNAKGFGFENIENKIPVTENTRFAIAR
jgi:CubicO group peptidase (beta-lactamase class C family)